jgi:hypothetical protein
MKTATLQKQYVMDENNQAVAVLLDLDTFRRLEERWEDQFLGEKMKGNENGKKMPLGEAKKYYAKLKKSP